MNWNDVRVLVTGAGGFIGSHLVEALAGRGAKVRAFVRYNSRGDVGSLSDVDNGILDRVEVRAGDLRDPFAVRSAMEDCEYVFHLGALIAIPYSYVHPRDVIDVNVLGTVNVLEAARSVRPVRVMHTSTSEVYGTARTVPISELHPLQGQSPYSASKIAADRIAESYYRSFDVPVVTIRPFNVYGPRQSARAVIPTIISQALAEQAIRLGNLTPTRDFTFVTDTVDGMIRSVEAANVLGTETNLGSGAEISIGDLARLILEIMGRPAELIADSQRVRPVNSEVERLMADNSRATRMLGWRPTVSLRAGLTQTIEWIAQHLERYRPATYQV